MVWDGNYILLIYLVQGNLTGVAYRDNISQPMVLPAMQAMDSVPTSRRQHQTAQVVSDFLQ